MCRRASLLVRWLVLCMCDPPLGRHSMSGAFMCVFLRCLLGPRTKHPGSPRVAPPVYAVYAVFIKSGQLPTRRSFAMSIELADVRVEETPAEEADVCFVCLEGPEGGELIRSICNCANRAIHLACQRELTRRTPAHANGYCAVCNTPCARAPASSSTAPHRTPLIKFFVADLRADTNVVAERRTRLTMDGRRCVALSLGALLLVAPGLSIPD